MKNNMLEARDLSLKFKDRLLFQISSLTIHSGDAIYLSGNNGIGKTSLLKILAGLQKPSTGTLTLRRPSLMQRLAGFSGQSGIVYLHQSPYLFDCTVVENILYGLKHRGLNRKARHELVETSLQMIGLENLKNMHVSALSGGEKQKVAMARAWVLNPSILLMDESCANLDPESIAIQLRMVEDLLASGSSFVITSHQMNVLTACCNQHWLLENQTLLQTSLLNNEHNIRM